MQVCGTEWVSHVTCRRKLMDELLTRAGRAGLGDVSTDGNGAGNGAGNGVGGSARCIPTRDIFNGMVSRQKRALRLQRGRAA